MTEQNMSEKRMLYVSLYSSAECMARALQYCNIRSCRESKEECMDCGK